MSFAEILIRLDSAGYQLVHLLLSLLWQSSIVFAGVAVITFLLRKRGGTVLYSLWIGAVLCLPLLPVLSYAISGLGAPHSEIAVIPLYEKPAPATANVQNIELNRQAASPVQTNSESVSDIPTPVSNIIPSLGIEPPAFESAPVDTVSILDFLYAYAFILYLSFAAVFLLLIAASRLRIRN